MPGFSNFHWDRISFLLGLLAASIFWWLLGKLKYWAPFIKKYLHLLKEHSQRRRLAGISYDLRKNTLNRAQTSHLIKNLCKLDDILIPPKLIAPPPYIEPGKTPLPMTETDQSIPYLPDWPELSSNFKVSHLTLAQALGNGANIVIVGHPGTGKTVALAHLASQLSRNEINVASIKDLVPIFLHILDFDFSKWKQEEDPTAIFLQALEQDFPGRSRRRIKNQVPILLKNGEAILLLDGFDELSPERALQASSYIKSLFSRWPGLRSVMTSSPDYLDGLLGQTLYPLSLATWSSQDRRLFLEKWHRIWNTKIKPSFDARAQYSKIESRMIMGWLEAENKSYSPLEWTLLTWGAFSGDMTGFTVPHALDAFLARSTHPYTPRLALESLSLELHQAGECSRAYTEIDRFFSKFNPAQYLGNFDTGEELKQKRKILKQQKISSSQRAINSLLDHGLFCEHTADQIRFISPFITGYLASYAFMGDPPRIQKDPWCIRNIALVFWISRNLQTAWVDQISASQDPFFQELLLASRALKYAPTTLPWRSLVLKQLLSLLHAEFLPRSIRARFLAAFVNSNDPSIPTLFRQLLKSPSQQVRSLAILGMGALNDPKSFPDLQKMLAGEDSVITGLSCLAITPRVEIEPQILINLLINGDENQRMIAAEALAYHPEGQEALKIALSSDDLLTRRAAIAGITRINNPWAIELLEKTAVEDGQWVVRNAALQALEILQNPSRLAPLPYCPPDQSPWLLAFAGKQGKGIPAGELATDLIVSALKEGTIEEKCASLEYLTRLPEPDIAREIYQVSQTENGELKDRCLLALWFLFASGVKLPVT